MNKQITSLELDRALLCADWIAGYNNPLAKETNQLLIMMVDEIKRLQKENSDDWKYICHQNEQLSARAEVTYDCGEL